MVVKAAPAVLDAAEMDLVLAAMGQVITAGVAAGHALALLNVIVVLGDSATV
jgi:hypothetical protein